MNIPYTSQQTAASSPFWDAGYRVLSIATRVLHLKERHILTRQNRLRLRYSVSAVAGMAMVMALYATGQISPSTDDLAGQAAFVSSLEPAVGQSEAAPILSFMVKPNVAGAIFSNNLNAHRDANGQIRRDREVLASAEMALEGAASESPAAEERHIMIGKGDTLAGVLTKAGLAVDEAQTTVNAIAKHIDMRSLRPGQEIELTLEPGETNTGYTLSELVYIPDPLRTVTVSRDTEGDIVASLDKKVITPAREAREVVIDGSVYGSADKAGLPDRVTANAIKLFSYAVDFQRDIRSGDKINVMFDSYKTDDGYVAKTGDIVFAKLTVSGREYALYRYQMRDGQVDYYTAEGKSIRKSSGLMRTPVAYGRMSSGFGVRTHPVLGYTKMHKGVDFAAPTGTPVYAAGNGVIEKASRFSSYGNYVRVRHSARLSTAYAHLSRYAAGVRPGVKVKQGQLIGYVGTTGRSTGPHLHYEVLVNGVQVNPRSVQIAVDNSLKGDELKRFKSSIRQMGQEYAAGLDTARVKVASRD